MNEELDSSVVELGERSKLKRSIIMFATFELVASVRIRAFV